MEALITRGSERSWNCPVPVERRRSFGPDVRSSKSTANQVADTRLDGIRRDGRLATDAVARRRPARTIAIVALHSSGIDDGVAAPLPNRSSARPSVITVSNGRSLTG